VERGRAFLDVEHTLELVARKETCRIHPDGAPFFSFGHVLEEALLVGLEIGRGGGDRCGDETCADATVGKDLAEGADKELDNRSFTRGHGHLTSGNDETIEPRSLDLERRDRHARLAADRDG
jgi:hypothetical protein